MASLAALLLAAAVQAPFGSAVMVTVDAGSALPLTGEVVGEFLVAAAPHPGGDGRIQLALRPLSLGELTVPLAGNPRPETVEVIATLAKDAALAPPRAPTLAIPRVWIALAGVVLASLAIAARHRRRTRSAAVDPLAVLRGLLAPLAEEQGWVREDGPDRLAQAVRTFLAARLATPCEAMTTRELTVALARTPSAERAIPFLAALELADAARFAGVGVSPEAGAICVAAVLDAAATEPEGGVG